jgi:hypothetical protein
MPRRLTTGDRQCHVQAAGAERLAVDHGVRVAGAADGGDDLRLTRERPLEVARGDLEAPEDAVMAPTAGPAPPDAR